MTTEQQNTMEQPSQKTIARLALESHHILRAHLSRIDSIGIMSAKMIQEMDNIDKHLGADHKQLKLLSENQGVLTKYISEIKSDIKSTQTVLQHQTQHLTDTLNAINHLNDLSQENTTSIQKHINEKSDEYNEQLKQLSTQVSTLQSELTKCDYSSDIEAMYAGISNLHNQLLTFQESQNKQHKERIDHIRKIEKNYEYQRDIISKYQTVIDSVSSTHVTLAEEVESLEKRMSELTVEQTLVAPTDFENLYAEKAHNISVDDLITISEPVVEPVVETVVKTHVEPVVEPVVETVVETHVEPVVETVVETHVEPHVEPVVETVVETHVEPVEETVVETHIEPVIEPVEETLVEPVNEIPMEHVEESNAEDAIEDSVDESADKDISKSESVDKEVVKKASDSIVTTNKSLSGYAADDMGYNAKSNSQDKTSPSSTFKLSVDNVKHDKTNHDEDNHDEDNHDDKRKHKSKKFLGLF